MCYKRVDWSEVKQAISPKDWKFMQEGENQLSDEKFDWFYIPDYPIIEEEDFLEFYLDEIIGESQTKAPIVLYMEDYEHSPTIIDGYHRVADALRNEQPVLPAYVGFPKD